MLDGVYHASTTRGIPATNGRACTTRVKWMTTISGRSDARPRFASRRRARAGGAEPPFLLKKKVEAPGVATA
jgi:hypothetical protein